jgi:hypothetical protein
MGVGQQPQPSSAGASGPLTQWRPMATRHLPQHTKGNAMPEPAAPHPSTTATTTRPRPSRNGTAPPTPSEVTKAPARTQRAGALDRFRTAVASLRQMMRRTFHRK